VNKAFEGFKAITDLNFALDEGELRVIIGPNGAGKSTILKILIRLLRPTRGHSLVRGRVGSLIEIGGSLHPDLTGRENIFLQGSVMGMRRAEIARKFDDIVAFSELGDFIDTPVKRYSSGMNARLGFSVAAHLEADVLIIDEVLAVGDAAFQKRAFERMKEMVGRGVPAVVVSHQLERIASLCSGAILIVKGAIVHQGTAAECIAAYAGLDSEAAPSSDGHDGVRIASVRVTGPQPVASGAHAEVVIAGVAGGTGAARPVVGVRVRSLQTGDVVFATGTISHELQLPAGPFELRVALQMNVPEGVYAVESTIGQWQRERRVETGPAALVQVTGGRWFWGQVQMNCAMRLEVNGAGGSADD
jgi:ABC-type polysaccharide/polyol phosphate transport system ATPase subunit